MPRFEGGMKRDIASAEQPEAEGLSDEQKQEKKLNQFEENRAKAWTGHEDFRGMEAEAVDEKSSTERMQEGALERLEEYEKKIEALREEISQKKDGWISRLTELKQIRELEAHLKMTERMKSIAEEDKKRTDELIAGYDHIIAKDQNLTSIKAEAKAIMEASAAERLEAKEQEEKMRSVEDIARRHNCFMVHDLVVADWKPTENNEVIDTKGLSVADQLDIILGLDPTISASSLQEGVPGDGTFGRDSWGVFLGEGRILGGATSDIDTQPLGRRNRPIPEHMRSVKSIDDAIDRESRRTGEERGKSYNEIVVERPEVAGVYMKWNDNMPPLQDVTSVQNQENGRNYDTFWRDVKSVAKRNVPIFVLTQDNRTRLIHDINFQEKTFQVAEGDISPADMVNLPGIYKQHLGEYEKRAAAMRQINTVRHLLSSDETTDIENGTKTTFEDTARDPYALH